MKKYSKTKVFSFFFLKMKYLCRNFIKFVLYNYVVKHNSFRLTYYD